MELKGRVTAAVILCFVRVCSIEGCGVHTVNLHRHYWLGSHVDYDPHTHLPQNSSMDCIRIRADGDERPRLAGKMSDSASSDATEITYPKSSEQGNYAY